MYVGEVTFRQDLDIKIGQRMLLRFNYIQMRLRYQTVNVCWLGYILMKI